VLSSWRVQMLDNPTVLRGDVVAGLWLKPFAPVIMPVIAARLLAAGHDSPALRAAAGLVARTVTGAASAVHPGVLVDAGGWIPARAAACARLGGGCGLRRPRTLITASPADLAHQLPHCEARSCCHGAAIQQEGPTAVSGDQASDLHLPGSGAGFEPATSGVMSHTTPVFHVSHVPVRLADQDAIPMSVSHGWLRLPRSDWSR
jgi:hypothetical protein